MQSHKIAVFYVPFPNSDSAQSIFTKLLQERLIACANLTYALSFYTWKGNQETSQEVIVLMKTLPEKRAEVRSILDNEHPYDCPCIAHFEFEVNPAYYDWVKESVE